jgi:hypothetical protein
MKPGTPFSYQSLSFFLFVSSDLFSNKPSGSTTTPSDFAGTGFFTSSTPLITGTSHLTTYWFVAKSLQYAACDP